MRVKGNEFFWGGSVFDLQGVEIFFFPKVAQIWSGLRKDKKKKFLTFLELGGGFRPKLTP